MFFIKKLLSELLYPMPFTLLVSAAVLLFFILKKRKEAAAAAVPFILLALITFPPLPRLLASPLERQYEKLDSIPSGVSAVVVLGGGSCADGTVPVSSQLSSASLTRLSEGLSLWRKIPTVPLIVTGGALFDTVTIAQIQKNMAASLGADSSKIGMADSALDTEMEARAVKKMISGKRIILVTSAMHMPRAVLLFKKAGLEPIPAPTHFLTSRSKLTPSDFFPSGWNAHVLTAAVHEYLGIIWSKLRNRI